NTPGTICCSDSKSVPADLTAATSRIPLEEIGSDYAAPEALSTAATTFWLRLHMSLRNSLLAGISTRRQVTKDKPILVKIERIARRASPMPIRKFVGSG